MSRTEKLRPFPMGVSLSHDKVTAGTAGCIVVDHQGQEYILSNNHVLANSNLGEIGDSILQPGTYDGGTVEDTIGILADFVEIKFPDSSDCQVSNAIISLLNLVSRLFLRKTRFYTKIDELPMNEVDCAIARPTSQDIYTPEILEIGHIKGSAKAKEGETVKKSGRTTGLTTGVIIDDDATIEISYGYRKTRFFNQILIQGKRFIQGGDSGSVLVNEDGYVVGLCFAGSGEGNLGIANHAYRVEELLEIRIKPN